jgi:hypothetical protein
MIPISHSLPCSCCCCLLLLPAAAACCCCLLPQNGGGEHSGHPWTPELPCDSALLFYLFAAFVAAPGWNFPPPGSGGPDNSRWARGLDAGPDPQMLRVCRQCDWTGGGT